MFIYKNTFIFALSFVQSYANSSPVSTCFLINLWMLKLLRYIVIKSTVGNKRLPVLNKACVCNHCLN